MTEHRIAVGALVHLKDGGGPTMTVTLISGDEFECSWGTDGGGNASQRFLERELAVVVEEGSRNG